MVEKARNAFVRVLTLELRGFRLALVALQDADGAAEGGEFNLGQAAADRAKQPFCVARRRVADPVRIRLEKVFGAVVHVPGGGLRVQVERIGTCKADFHQATSTLHAVNAGADEVAVEKNVSGSGGQIHAAQGGLQDLRATADRTEIEFASALSADQCAAGRVHNDVAGNLFQVYIAVYGDQIHITQDLFYVDQTGLRFDLEFGLFRNRQLNIFCQIGSRSGRVQNFGADFDAIIGLFHFQTDLVAGTRSRQHNFRILPGLHFNAPVRDVLNHYDRAAFYREVFLSLLRFGQRSEREQEQADSDDRRGQRKHGSAEYPAQDHLSLRSCRAPSLRPKFLPSAGMQWKGIRAPSDRLDLPRGACGIP